jgi:hypothetical protein
VYGLFEYSRSEPEHGEGFFSGLAEARVATGRHEPYARLEIATRPEFAREGGPETDDFFRYDHDAAPIGATRWTIATLGYGISALTGTIAVRPFVETQYSGVSLERGPAELRPDALFGASGFWTVSFGARLFFGGGPMRMGAYGVLDPMTSMNRTVTAVRADAESRTTGQTRGRDIDSRGAETIVLVRESSGWRIRHIHWSSR